MRLPGMLPPHHRPRMQPQTHRQHPTVGSITRRHLQPLHPTTHMKQITTKQAQDFSCTDPYVVKIEIKVCQANWIRENARHIADIEAKRCDKTFYGTYPKGWRHAMKSESEKQAKDILLKQVLNQECVQLDGAIWLNNMQLINQLEKQ
jgi:hypothetical protein